MDWFERLTGFREINWEETQSRLVVKGNRLHSRISDRSCGMGTFSMPSLGELRERASEAPGRLKVRVISGDVRALHQLPEYAGALFQVASQFNALEMPGPDVTPESGVTGYAGDHTQGPACAIAAGAATIYRNYLVPCRGALGQRRDRQLDGLADLGDALTRLTGRPLAQLWRMQNGYALARTEGLRAIAAALETADTHQMDALRAKLRIAVHADVEVTDGTDHPGPFVSQAFCSALPVTYTNVTRELWRPFATLVLEAAYEATLLAALENAQRGGTNIVLLTLLGGGVFGNDSRWIHAAMFYALDLMRDRDLDVRVVCYGAASASTLNLVDAFA